MRRKRDGGGGKYESFILGKEKQKGEESGAFEVGTVAKVRQRDGHTR